VLDFHVKAEGKWLTCGVGLPGDPPLGTVLLGDGSNLLLEVGGGCVVRMIAVARPVGLSKAG
jgi:hypothetical protein